MVPAPRRGELVRLIVEDLRRHKSALGSLIALETGKIKEEGDGEMQEMIDIGDFAVGQSRMLYGRTMHSERPRHRMYEQWHPLGVVGVITAFNFPAAVWAWNAFIAAVCGDVVDLEAFAESAAHRDRDSAHRQRRACARPATTGVFSLIASDARELAQCLVDDRARAAGLVHRIEPRRARGRANRRGAHGTLPARMLRQQRRHRRRDGRPRSRRCPRSCSVPSEPPDNAARPRAG